MVLREKTSGGDGAWIQRRTAKNIFGSIDFMREEKRMGER